jgi:hypothetical protein
VFGRAVLMFRGMRKRRAIPSAALPMMMTSLTVAAWETIFRRSMMMAQGTCSAAEYRRMGEEKAVAMGKSMTALMTGRGYAAAVAPFVTRARANARRLRGKK